MEHDINSHFRSNYNSVTQNDNKSIYSQSNNLMKNIYEKDEVSIKLLYFKSYNIVTKSIKNKLYQ